MLILHDRDTGTEFAINPGDVRMVEAEGERCIVYFVAHVQVGMTKLGNQVIPPHIETLIHTAHVLESLHSVQRMIIRLGAMVRGSLEPAMVIDHECEVLAGNVREHCKQPFGQGPRE